MVESDLKSKIHRHLISKTDFLQVKDKLSETQLRVYVDKAITDLCFEERIDLKTEDRVILIRQLVNAALALGPLGPLLQDSEVTEIMVNGFNKVYIQRRGKLERADIQFDSNDHLTHTIEKMLAASGTNRRVDESNPYVDFPLTDGSRVNVLLPPCSLIGPVMTIRKFANIGTVEDLIRLGTLNQDMATLLTAAMTAKLNVVFCGATGTGKTTTLNVFSRHIPTHERIITIEDTPELRLMQDHVVSLQTKDANIEGKGVISIRDLFVNALRMRPDRIIIGEVRSKEMLDLIESISSGHSGSLSIIHAESPQDCFNRMVTMMLLTGIQLDTEVIMQHVAHAIDLIVHSELYPDGRRRVSHITDFYYNHDTKQVAYHDVFRFVEKEGSEDGKVIGDWVFNRKKPSIYEKFKKRHIKFPKEFFED